MPHTISFPCYVIGLMSGTSADGVDAALLYTDGRDIVRAHESVFVPYDDALRTAVLGLMRGQGEEAAIAAALTEVHIVAVDKLLAATPIAAAEIKLIGFHGQTIRHAPERGITQQIGDAEMMAKRLRIPVVADFRSADVKAGGQGAPLVPFFHAALAHDLQKPVMVVNIGGVANVTWLGTGGEIVAFDCGPGNALIDDWVQTYSGHRYDKNGELAAKGAVDEAAVAQFLTHEFFARAIPKSLDRNQFNTVIPALCRDPAKPPGQARDGKMLEDSAATLTAITAAAIANACDLVPQKPQRLLIAGGGRHNATLMHEIKTRTQCHVDAVEHLGWDGDMLEAQAFAYLAARSMLGLPLSLPSTTGVATPTPGGVFYPI